MGSIDLLLWHRWTEPCHNSLDITLGPEAGHLKKVVCRHSSLRNKRSYSPVFNIQVGISNPGLQPVKVSIRRI